ncbi:MAG: hypothetical protein KDD38_05635, partial [Bdellovibrionales bacterium]|nr:hypothetical protein [Bdellovibrionales bacterium]
EPPATVLDKGFFDANLLPSFVKSCDRCHDNPAPTYEEAVLLVVPGDISKSILYLLPAGGVMSDGDKHPAKWKVGSAEAAVLESWINGAKL